MTKIFDFIAFLIAITVIVFYCRMSHSAMPEEAMSEYDEQGLRICYNQGIMPNDGCDTYIMTD